MHLGNAILFPSMRTDDGISHHALRDMPVNPSVRSTKLFWREEAVVHGIICQTSYIIRDWHFQSGSIDHVSIVMKNLYLVCEAFLETLYILCCVPRVLKLTTPTDSGNAERENATKGAAKAEGDGGR